jgi:hypothetical protein
LSVDTNAEKIEDFAILHNCVTLAREEIKLNTTIPALLKMGTNIQTIAGQRAYSLYADFDVPVKCYYSSGSDEWELEQAYAATIKEKVTKLSDSGTPSWYVIADTANAITAPLVQCNLYNVPNVSNDSFFFIYKPILAEITISTDYDILMRKYPHTVIKFATAFASQIIKKDMVSFEKFYLMGKSDCQMIDSREMQADTGLKELPDGLMRGRRQGRLSK